jgi:hypothetical protein
MPRLEQFMVFRFYNPGRFIVGQCLLGRGIRYNNAILSLCISSYN